jgi:beta-galactosidase
VRRRGVDTVVIPVGPNVSKELKFTSKYRLMWEVPYAPGVLKAVGKRNGKTIAAEVKTAGAAARLRLEADRATIEAGGEDLSFVTVRVEDAAGNLCPLAEDQIRFKVSGAGEIAAVDNGNAATVEPFQADRRKAFSGMALVIVRGARGKRGLVELEASAAGLSPASVRLQVR